MKSEEFTKSLSGKYKTAWNAFILVVSNVLGGERASEKDMRKYVKKMMTALKNIKSSMTLKMHLMNNHLDDFLKQDPKESDEHGEHFHQVTMPMEERFKGKRLDAMIAEVCWWSVKKSLFQEKAGIKELHEVEIEHEEGETNEEEGGDEEEVEEEEDGDWQSEWGGEEEEEADSEEEGEAESEEEGEEEGDEGDSEENDSESSDQSDDENEPQSKKPRASTSTSQKQQPMDTD